MMTVNELANTINDNYWFKAEGNQAELKIKLTAGSIGFFIKGEIDFVAPNRYDLTWKESVLFDNETISGSFKNEDELLDIIAKVNYELNRVNSAVSDLELAFNFNEY
ncbi:TPA: hypothetical protein VBM32_002199 [Streptococcus agalactiae]|nr:hypothetical protein [Streptococcus agalactiae]